MERARIATPRRGESGAQDMCARWLSILRQRSMLHVAGECVVYTCVLLLWLHILQHFISVSVLHAIYPLRRPAAAMARHRDEHSPGTDCALIDNNIKKFPTFTCLALHRPHTYTKMAFSFGFSGDDIEEDPNDVGPQTRETNTPGENVPPPIPARAHNLDELVRSHQYHKSNHKQITNSIATKIKIKPSSLHVSILPY